MGITETLLADIEILKRENARYKEALEEIASTAIGCWTIPSNCEKCLSCVELGQDLRPYMIARQAMEVE
jgi:hypothetical protein